MKKVFMGMPSFSALGLKKQMLAVAIATGVGLSTIPSVEAAIARNANPPTLKASAPNVYVVKKGDTLWDISKKFLKNPVRWREIWASNKHVKNQHWIFPGDRLLMCDYQGRPIIGKDEGDGCAGIISRYAGATTLQPQLRVESLNNTIPVVQLEHIKHWLERAIIVSPETAANAPYVVGAHDERVLAGKGQSIYVRGADLVPGQRYAVYRQGEPYSFTDAQGNNINAGIELTQVASGVATKTQAGISTLELNQSFNDVTRRGDLVLPETDPMLPSLFYPTDASTVTAGGQIIRVLGSIGTAARQSVVTINRGTANGVQVGHAFAVQQEGQRIIDPKTKEHLQLPAEQIGYVMVFKAFDHLSYAYVLESERPIKVGALLIPSHTDE